MYWSCNSDLVNLAKHSVQPTHHNSVRVVNDNKEYILHQEGETEEKRYHSNSDGKAARIGAMVGTNSRRVIIQLVRYTSKHYNGEELCTYVYECMHVCI